eukprot:2051453-Prymnesium_polylepis.1
MSTAQWQVEAEARASRGSSPGLHSISAAAAAAAVAAGVVAVAVSMAGPSQRVERPNSSDEKSTIVRRDDSPPGAQDEEEGRQGTWGEG